MARKLQRGLGLSLSLWGAGLLGSDIVLWLRHGNI